MKLKYGSLGLLTMMLFTPTLNGGKCLLKCGAFYLFAACDAAGTFRLAESPGRNADAEISSGEKNPFGKAVFSG